MHTGRRNASLYLFADDKTMIFIRGLGKTLQVRILQLLVHTYLLRAHIDDSPRLDTPE